MLYSIKAKKKDISLHLRIYPLHIMQTSCYILYMMELFAGVPGSDTY